MPNNDAPVLLFSNDAKDESQEESNILVFKYDRNPNLNYKLAEEIIQENSFSMEYLKNTNVLYFDGKQYTLDFNEKYPIKINYIEGSGSTAEGSTAEGSDGPLLSTINDDNTITAVYTGLGDSINVYKRRQLEIRHINANGEILTLVVPFRSNKYYTLTYTAAVDDPNVAADVSVETLNDELENDLDSDLPINADDLPNIENYGLDLMDIIPKSDYYYYEKANGEIVIFFAEQIIKEDNAPELFNGKLRGAKQIVDREDFASLIDWSGVWGVPKYGLYNNYYPDSSIYPAINDSPITKTQVIDIDPPYLGPWHLSIDPPENITKLMSMDGDVKYVSSGTYYNDYYITAFIVNTIDYNMNREIPNDTARMNAGELPETYFDCQPVGASDEKILTGIYKDKYINLDETINKKANNIFSNIGSFFTSATASAPLIGKYISVKNTKMKPRRMLNNASSATGRAFNNSASATGRAAGNTRIRAGFTAGRKNSYSLNEGITEDYYPNNSLNYSNISEYSDNRNNIPQNTNDYYFEDVIKKPFLGLKYREGMREGNTTFDECDNVVLTEDMKPKKASGSFKKWVKPDCDNFSQSNWKVRKQLSWADAGCSSAYDQDVPTFINTAKSNYKSCMKEPRCHVKREDRQSKIDEYKELSKYKHQERWNLDAEEIDDDDELALDQDFVDMYDAGYFSNPQIDKIFKCETKEMNPISRLYLAIRNYIKNLIITIYRKHSSFGIGLQIGLVVVISFNVLLNKILDKKKPKKIERPP